MDDAPAGPRLGELLGGEIGRLGPGGGEDASLEVTDDQVDVELVMELLHVARELGRVAEGLAHEPARVTRRSPGRFLDEGAAGGQREDQAGRDCDHQQHAEEVKVDPREEAAQLSRPRAQACSRRRARS